MCRLLALEDLVVDGSKPTSRQRPEYCARNNRKGIARSVFFVVRAMPIATQRVAKHIPATIAIAGQQLGKHAFATIEEAVFSVCSPRNHISFTY
jgi:hypothetical protein